MILWIILFILVLAISYFLALRSMKDYQDVSKRGEEFGLYLVRKPHQLNKELLISIVNHLKKEDFVSFERLFKGNKSTLVVYGLKNLLINYKDLLELLELEDYTNIRENQISAWEMGVKKNSGVEKIFDNIPELSVSEQFWWQVISDKSLHINIRAIFISDNDLRKKELAEKLQKLSPDKLVKLPKAYSSISLLDFYRKRSFRKREESADPSTILGLIILN